jgi:tRNA-specific 2-thiouridylase
MLYRVDPEILPYCIFPLGDYSKDEVVRIAAKEGLPTAGVGESQDICFIEGNYVDYIEEQLGYRGEPGPIEDPAGRRLGTHRGYMNYTVGQRQGLGLSDGPWYVASIEAERNAVFVTRRDELGKRAFSVGGLHLMAPRPETFDAEVRVRYNSRPLSCRVERIASREDSSEHAEVYLEEDAVITPGQSAVFYEGDLLLGGGFILPEGRKRA